MRFAHGKDKNHKTIVEIFRLLGCSVVVIDRASWLTPDGKLDPAGVPDLLVGRNGDEILVEVKPEMTPGKQHDGVRRAQSVLRKDQVKFATKWKGRWVEVVRNATDAERVANGLGR